MEKDLPVWIEKGLFNGPHNASLIKPLVLFSKRCTESFAKDEKRGIALYGIVFFQLIRVSLKLILCVYLIPLTFNEKYIKNNFLKKNHFFVTLLRFKGYWFYLIRSVHIKRFPKSWKERNCIKWYCLWFFRVSLMSRKLHVFWISLNI